MYDTEKEVKVKGKRSEGVKILRINAYMIQIKE